MDGSSGPAAVIRRGCFAFLLAAVQAAFAVSGRSAVQHRQTGLALFDRGECDSAAVELLKAVSAGDSSHAVVLRLAQALECDDRMVDALSATYIDHRTDTTGRIDVLLYRAQLLRKLGLADEADKVEKEAGVEIVASLGAGASDAGAPSWNWSPTASGSFGWMLQDDVISVADSLRLVSSRIGIRAEVLKKLIQPRSSTDDSVHIQGQQIPLLATMGWEADWSDYYAWIGVPLQAILKTDLSGWLVTAGRVLLQAGAQWSNRWFATDATVYGSKNWTFYPGSDPVRNADLNASLELKRTQGSSKIVQSNSGNVALNEEYAFSGYTGAHSLGFVQDLPWGSSLSLGVGYSYFLDRSREEFENLSDFTVKFIDVQGIRLGMTNQDSAINFLDSNGVAIDNPLFIRQARNGVYSAQHIAIQSGYDYPVDSKRDWGRWNSGILLTKNFGQDVTLKFGLDLSRTELVHPQRGTFVPDTSLYTTRWATTGVMIVYHDVETGERFWDGDQVTGSSYFLGPIYFERHRVDHAATVTAAATWRIQRHLSATASWVWVRNESNLAHLVEGSSYTRNLWNASATVSW